MGDFTGHSSFIFSRLAKASSMQITIAAMRNVKAKDWLEGMAYFKNTPLFVNNCGDRGQNVADIQQQIS